jgi:hypothetical protein
MRKFKSHKIVEAAKILDLIPDERGGAILTLSGAQTETRQVVAGPWLDKHRPGAEDTTLVGGYFVRYPDGYESWSPAAAFEEGYAPADTMASPLPVSGYKAQPQEVIDAVNGFKADEERVLRKLDDLRESCAASVDQRWLAIGRTQLEQAFMAINRSLFRPGRAVLLEDKPEAQA